MYILECSDKSFYVGSTIDLDNRINQHQSSLGANYTKKRLPIKLLYFEEFNRIDLAFEREKQIQGWSRKKKEALMKGDYEKLHEYAACMNETHHRSASAGFGSAQPPEVE
ncbi:MAG: GIY-YIG nuclease family protein [Bacteroidia bacterium]|nr:GIY-YIG nuclease family protein [Bacteroidia bacterium]